MGKQRKQSEMYALVQQYLSSGLSKKEFCQTHGIKVHTFQYWVSKYNKEQVKGNEDKFLPLAIKESSRENSQVIRLSYPSGMIVEFPII